MTSEKSPIPGAKILLMGDSGTGKTHSLRTLLDAGITPFVIFTEPGMEVLGDLGGHRYHYHYVPPALSNWTALADIADKVNKLPYEGLIKMVDTNRSKYTQFIDVININNNFICDHCGQQFGDVQTWGTDRALVLDSLTGLNKMVMKLHVGGRVAIQLQDWGVAQQTLMPLIDAWTAGGTRCWFILIAHESMERDEITGATKRMVNTLGKAIAPEVPRFFSDVIEAVRAGDKFTWDTSAANATVKARNTTISAGLPASFVPLVESWKKKGGIIEKTGEKAP